MKHVDWCEVVRCGVQIRLVGRSLLVPGADDRVVVVRDDEPTSLVAYALSSRCVEFNLHI